MREKRDGVFEVIRPCQLVLRDGRRSALPAAPRLSAALLLHAGRRVSCVPRREDVHSGGAVQGRPCDLGRPVGADLLLCARREVGPGLPVPEGRRMRRRRTPRPRKPATVEARLDQLEEELAVVNGVLAYLVKRTKVIEIAQLAEIRRLDRLIREAKR
jgi:hypothetical protein